MITKKLSLFHRKEAPFAVTVYYLSNAIIIYEDSFYSLMRFHPSYSGAIIVLPPGAGIDRGILIA